MVPHVFRLIYRQAVASLWLCGVYVRNVRLIGNLPIEIINPSALDAKTKANPNGFHIDVPTIHAEQYNIAMNDAKSMVKSYNSTPGTAPSFRTLRIVFTIIRIMTLYRALTSSDVFSVIAVSAIQFVIMPYSFVVALSQLVALAPMLYLSHLVGFGFLHFLISAFMPSLHQMVSITIDTRFVVAFLCIDQLLCFLTLFWLPGETPERKPVGRVIKSIVWGFLNCKSYVLVLLLLIRGTQVNLMLWVLDAVFGLTNRMGSFLCNHLLHWAPLFYSQHRIGHLPLVYEHAHKFHHHLHGTTSFDAHIYGSGAPEEWHTLMYELGCALVLGIPPPFLNPEILRWSWENKVGHTRAEGGTMGRNMHCDHHTRHNKNFGIFSCLLDMYMGTLTEKDTYTYGDFDVKMSPHGEGNIRFTLTPMASKSPAESSTTPAVVAH